MNPAGSLLIVLLTAFWLPVSPAAAQQPAPLPELPVDRQSDDRPSERNASRPTDQAGSPSLDSLGRPANDITAEEAAQAAHEAQQYRECLSIANEDPRSALDFAFAWQAGGGNLAAKHCAAIAYSALDRFALAAERLDEVARDLRTGRELPAYLAGDGTRTDLLAQVYAQLGNARLLEGNTDAAYAAFSSGLAALTDTSAPIRLELLIDRARALGAGGDFTAALENLEKARTLAPERADIALFLASAHRALGNLDAALDAVSQALEIQGETAAGLLERGNIRMMRDEPAAARENWTTIVERWPESPAARAARANLDRLDHDIVGPGGGSDR